MKGGLNLLDTYPIKFRLVEEEIASDTKLESFEFQTPDKQTQQVIINLCPTEPWALPNLVVSDTMIPFLNQLKEIKSRFFSHATFSLVLNKNETGLVKAAKKFTHDTEWLQMYAFEPKYPLDDPTILAKRVLSLDIEFGQNLQDYKTILMDAQTVFAVYETGILKNKVNTRFLAVSGTGLKENEIVKVQLGTSFHKIIKHRVKEAGKYRVFVNGPMRGEEITDLSQKIDWSVNNITVLKTQDTKIVFPMIKPEELVLTTNVLGEYRRCVYCNFCDDICPVDLEPALYYHAYERGEKEKALLYDLDTCIECGLCSFICPSKIELLKIIRECKKLGS